MKKLFVILILTSLVLGCGSSRQVERLAPETQTDLSGRWNDTDARLVAEEMIDDCLHRPWLTDFVAATGDKPVVTVGTIRNKSSEHIDAETFTTDFERELINSGQVRFVGSRDQRQEIREERFEQQDFASRETMKKIRAETGADFILLGAIKSITDEIEGVRVVFYQTDLELINIESMEKVWIGTKKIKKGISKGKTKW
ncbi:MAG: penicillin-binding protein activator LpoB [Candidatus Zixiibacteriota bacterium]|nr:MAG: penicillin-binding protein activator LpoB [candidate division Zixibacteria bacterium]HHI02058.1 penicillin-binding protein activator LpoB [candidate division Zixibacteria bacterium]